MKQMKRMKSLLMVAMIAVLLTATISGTIAWLETKTESIKNVFTPAEVDTDITETVEGDVKKSVQIKNAGNVSVYVRVAIVANWVKDGKVVESADVSVKVSGDWEKNGDYYYYKKLLEPSTTTSNLLKDTIQSSTREDGAHLEVTVIHQSIQAEPIDAVKAAWGEDIANMLPSSND